jgi:hypothetical protein
MLQSVESTRHSVGRVSGRAGLAAPRAGETAMSAVDHDGLAVATLGAACSQGHTTKCRFEPTLCEQGQLLFEPDHSVNRQGSARGCAKKKGEAAALTITNELRLSQGCVPHKTF